MTRTVSFNGYAIHQLQTITKLDVKCHWKFFHFIRIKRRRTEKNNSTAINLFEHFLIFLLFLMPSDGHPQLVYATHTHPIRIGAQRRKKKRAHARKIRTLLLLLIFISSFFSQRYFHRIAHFVFGVSMFLHRTKEIR